MEHVDHVVIGAGAMGSATAWWLARRGRSVVLVERFAAGHTRGSSHGGTRIFRFGYADPRYVRHAMRALERWRELEDDAGVRLLDLVGVIDHGPVESVTPVADALAACGATVDRWTPEEAEARFPGMRFDGAVVHSPDGGRARAADTLAVLAERTRAHGGTVVHEAGPATVEPVGDDAAVVRCDVGAWRARSVVVTAGAWLPQLVGAHVALPPLTVTEEQVVHFTPRERAVEDWPSFIHHTTPNRYGLATPGEGVKVGGHHEGPVVSPDHRADGLDDEALARAVEYVTAWLPGLDPTPHSGARCLYTTTASEDFVVDRVGPLVIGSPCSGHGFKFTPLIGELLADLATDPATEVPAPFLRLSR